MADPTPGELLAAKLRANIENPALRMLPGGAAVREALASAAAFAAATDERLARLESRVAAAEKVTDPHQLFGARSR
jgi:hypothetical protein